MCTDPCGTGALADTECGRNAAGDTPRSTSLWSPAVLVAELRRTAWVRVRGQEWAADRACSLAGPHSAELLRARETFVEELLDALLGSSGAWRRFAPRPRTSRPPSTRSCNRCRVRRQSGPRSRRRSFTMRRRSARSSPRPPGPRRPRSGGPRRRLSVLLLTESDDGGEAQEPLKSM